MAMLCGISTSKEKEGRMGAVSANEWPQLVDMALMPPASNQYHHHHHHGYSQHNHSITSSVIPAIAAAQTTTTTATTTTAARRGAMDSPAAPVGSGGGSGNQQTTESSQPQQPQPALKCPRCDSSNTKFCYYNNYSLSQPRHFCKACKRYWTRGGTLRNVPVGGGCRKNKRIKKPATATSSGNKPAPSSSDGSSSHPSQPISSLSLPNTSSQIDASADIAPLLYALSNASASDLGLSSSFRQKLQQQGLPSCTAYDLHPQLSALGLSFPLNPNAQQQGDEDVRYQSGFKTHHLPQFQSQESSAAAATSAPPSLLHDSPFLNSSFSSASAASLLAATLRQPTTTTTTKISPSGWSPYGDLQQAVALTGTENFGGLKGIKEEQGNVGMCHSSGNRMEWQHVPFNENYALDIAAIGGADSSMYWNSSAMGGGVAGGWADATNC